MAPILCMMSSMHPSVEAKFYEEMTLLEGVCRWLYFDTHKPPLATTGIGNMIDAGSSLTQFGRALPWRRSSGDYLTETSIQTEYDRLKALGPIGNGFDYESHAQMFLDPDVVQWMFDKTAKSFASIVAPYFPQWDFWPADAQMAIMSGAWNMGPKFPSEWTTLTALLNAGKFYDAAYKYLINQTPIKDSARNRRNRIYLLQAAMTTAIKRPVTALYGQGPISVAKVVWAANNPGSVGYNSWLVQAMLKETKDYLGPLDGKFGLMSVTALKQFCRIHMLAYGINMTVLNALSMSTIRMAVAL